MLIREGAQVTLERRPLVALRESDPGQLVVKSLGALKALLSPSGELVNALPQERKTRRFGRRLT